MESRRPGRGVVEHARPMLSQQFGSARRAPCPRADGSRPASDKEPAYLSKAGGWVRANVVGFLVGPSSGALLLAGAPHTLAVPP
jgi:hypothetical protein